MHSTRASTDRGTLTTFASRLALVTCLGAVGLAACGGSHDEAASPTPDPARVHDAQTARAAGQRADAKPDDAALQRAAFDAAARMFATKGRYAESFEREVWPALQSSVDRVTQAAEDCPTKLLAAQIHTGAGDRAGAVTLYTSEKVRGCIDGHDVEDVSMMIREGNKPHCAEGLQMAPDFWKKAPPGHFLPTVALGEVQINVLDMIFDCGGADAASAYVAPKDLAEYRRYKADSEATQRRSEAAANAQAAVENCNDRCMDSFGEGDSACMKECHARSAGSQCVEMCRAAMDQCTKACGGAR